MIMRDDGEEAWAISRWCGRRPDRCGATDDGRVRVFRGVRYAAPPTGERRWRPPVPPQPWTEPADATRFGPVAPQAANPVINLVPAPCRTRTACSERVVGVLRSALDGRPVLVWVHGGAYLLGASSQPLYDASSFVAAGDVVVVTINYRVGALGLWT